MRRAETAKLYLAVGCGAGVGAFLRFLSGAAIAELGANPLWATALVNIVGSFVIVFFAASTGPAGRWHVGLAARQFVMGGICGGFTTFSAMSVETILLMLGGEPMRATFHIVSVVALSLLAGWVGHMLAKRPKDKA
ncbi:putative fluoride ion transporter CrcB 1 [Brucella endophytica]|uniref:Fluoride-specific ion channel FluC n=1 Tax=Brucella endophytica TaxID=1963359 RepID=A0A916W8J0_9HYPH|nr:CrcB family protein [Brucella endophytica]GGA77899.1 putative fluoride ion transporter CrcB 1 [Brucella endophytica]